MKEILKSLGLGCIERRALKNHCEVSNTFFQINKFQRCSLPKYISITPVSRESDGLKGSSGVIEGPKCRVPEGIGIEKKIENSRQFAQLIQKGIDFRNKKDIINLFS